MMKRIDLASRLGRTGWLRLLAGEVAVLAIGTLLLFALFLGVDLDRLGWAVLLRHP